MCWGGYSFTDRCNNQMLWSMWSVLRERNRTNFTTCIFHFFSFDQFHDGQLLMTISCQWKVWNVLFSSWYLNVFSSRTAGFHRQSKLLELYFFVRITFLWMVKPAWCPPLIETPGCYPSIPMVWSKSPLPLPIVIGRGRGDINYALCS